MSLIDRILPGRLDRRKLGAAGEARAAAYLTAQGLRLLGCNYRVRGGEIDLICQDGDTLAFVEVRLRSGSGFGGAAASITTAKQRRLIVAARHWLATHGERPCRFDCVLIDGERLEWLRDAFSAD
jgi:putative endonuclease